MKRTFSREIERHLVRALIIVLCLILWMVSGTVMAQPAPGEAAAAPAAAPAAPAGAKSEELAKQLSNPIASLVSVPFQSNWHFGVGPQDDTQYVLNIQPVMPFSLNKKWNLIQRIILPIVDQPSLIPGGTSSSGFGDVVASTFFSPVNPTKRGWIWGAGPVFLVPLSNNPALGSQQWGIGPTLVVLKQKGPLTYGMLANHIWSFAGKDDRPDVNSTFLQPFFAYTTKRATTFTINSESSANWEASSGNTWTVPINFLVSQVVSLAGKPVSIQGGGGYFVEAPEGGPEWKLRFAITFLFPKTKKG